MQKIYLVEDDATIVSVLAEYLQQWGYECVSAKNFASILQEFHEIKPDLVLLDISLPYYNGYHWCQEIRKTSEVPIIFLSSMDQQMNQIMAMNMGADDYITKPFQVDILVAKINALLRRSYNYAESGEELEHNGITLNIDNSSMTINGEVVDLSKNEYRLLFILMKQHGKILSRDKLLCALWDDERFVDDNTLTVNINRLRRKIEQAGIDDYIQTKVGQGYIVP